MYFDPVARFFWEGRVKAGWREPPRLLYDCELVYIREGAMEIRLEDQAATIRAGGLVIIPPAMEHESFVTERATRWCVHFDWTPDRRREGPALWTYPGEPYEAEARLDPPPAIADRLPLIVATALEAELQDVLRQALMRIRDGDRLGDRLLWPVLRCLLDGDSPSSEAPRSALGKTGRTVMALKQAIDENYAKPMDYSDFTALTRLSKSHLCQAFSRCIGKPPQAYLNDVRLHHARRLLEAGHLNVSEVARAVGIPDANYFSRLYRKRYDHTPSGTIMSYG